MDCVVSPVDHKFPVEAEEVRTTEFPSQNVVTPPAVIVGVAGVYALYLLGKEINNKNSTHCSFILISHSVPWNTALVPCTAH